MDTLLNVVQNYDYVINERGDPRVKDWLLMSSPWPVVILIALYLHIVLSSGPRFMAKRQPFNFPKTIIVLNALQVLVNVRIVKELVEAELNWNYNIWCQPLDYSNNPRALRVAAAIWTYLLLKVLDLSDTVFMILRKKERQISFLHVFHHSTTLAMAWCVTKYAAGGLSTFSVVWNSAIHVIMYAYYLLAAMGPGVQKYLWWKKYLTTFQIIQLAALGLHNTVALITNCNYPKPLLMCIIPILVVNLTMFLKFYKDAYNSKRKTK